MLPTVSQLVPKERDSKGKAKIHLTGSRGGARLSRKLVDKGGGLDCLLASWMCAPHQFLLPRGEVNLYTRFLLSDGVDHNPQISSLKLLSGLVKPGVIVIFVSQMGKLRHGKPHEGKLSFEVGPLGSQSLLMMWYFASLSIDRTAGPALDNYTQMGSLKMPDDPFPFYRHPSHLPHSHLWLPSLLVPSLDLARSDLIHTTSSIQPSLNRDSFQQSPLPYGSHLCYKMSAARLAQGWLPKLESRGDKGRRESNSPEAHGSSAESRTRAEYFHHEMRLSRC